MTNSEAISIITQIKEIITNDNSWSDVAKVAVKEAFDLAIKALGERLQGEWIITGEEQGAFGINYKIRKCDKCGWEHSLVIPDNFCPRCGAKMKKGGAE